MSWLDPLAALYGTGVRVRNELYARKIFRAARLPVPVLSVGNVTVGGNGKTPFVRFLAEHFISRGISTAVLSRGYGRKSRADFVLVSDGKSILATADEAGDEPVEIARLVPGAIVAVGADRYRVGLAVLARFESRVILLDDGFQHRRLSRDLDLVLMDVGARREDMQLLPKGRLREPLSSLGRADAFVWTRSREGRPELDLELTIPVFRASSEIAGCTPVSGGGTLPSSAWAGRPVAVVTAIASPERLIEEVESTGARVVWRELRRDHHYWTRAEVDRASDTARRHGAEALITTGKDGTKLDSTHPTVLPLYTVDLRLSVAPTKEFFELLSSRLKLDGI